MKIERRSLGTRNDYIMYEAMLRKGSFGHHMVSTVLRTNKPHLARWPFGRWIIWELK